MKNKSNNFAYIDGANLHKGIRSLGWKLDYARFKAILSPAPANKCSILLKRTGAPIVYLEDKKALIEVQNEKAPSRNASMQGSSS